MIRLIITLIFVFLFLLVSIPILCVEWVIRKYSRQKADFSSLRIVQWAFKVIIGISGVRLTVIGEENIPKEEAVLYVPNHQSYYDIILTYARCPGLTGYVAKNSMIRIPVFSSWMKRLYCLFLNREDLKEGLKTILVGIDQMKQGISMCIFPEGTRNKNYQEMMPFKEGSLKMAEKTGCPIIPMALTGTADILENHFPWIRSAHVTLQYGEPIYPGKLDRETKKRLGSYTQTKILEMLNESKQLQS